MKVCPAVLSSYYYLKPFLKNRHGGTIRNWILDSGAFSAFNSGVSISLEEFTDEALRLQETDPTLKEIYALDVIGDWKASERNTEFMWKRGVRALPTWHAGEPWELLTHLAKAYPKIGIGGLVGILPQVKPKIVERVFALAWPAKMHGFGVADEKLLTKFPFHSADATSWVRASKYGIWSAFDHVQLPVRMRGREMRQSFDVEVRHYLRVEKRVRDRWAATMRKQGWDDAPTVRLALLGQPEEFRYMKEHDV